MIIAAKSAKRGSRPQPAFAGDRHARAARPPLAGRGHGLAAERAGAGHRQLVRDESVQALDAVRHAAQAGAWQLDDPRATAVFLFSGAHAVIDDAYSKEKRIDRKRLARRLECLCLRAVGLPAA